MKGKKSDVGKISPRLHQQELPYRGYIKVRGWDENKKTIKGKDAKQRAAEKERKNKEIVQSIIKASGIPSEYNRDYIQVAFDIDLRCSISTEWTASKGSPKSDASLSGEEVWGE